MTDSYQLMLVILWTANLLLAFCTNTLISIFFTILRVFYCFFCSLYMAACACCHCLIKTWWWW